MVIGPAIKKIPAASLWCNQEKQKGCDCLRVVINDSSGFSNGTLRLMDSSPTVWSFRLLDSSPTDITHLILFYSGSLVGKMKSNL